MCIFKVLKHHVDWLELFMAWSEPLCLFPIFMYEHPRVSFGAKTLSSRQPEECEEQFAEFEKKCIGIRIVLD